MSTRKRKKKTPQDKRSELIIAAVGVALQVLAILVDILLWIVKDK